MCGIAGMWMPEVGASDALVGEMIVRLGHRGPDSTGRWQGSVDTPSLGQARLAIVDLSEQGSQPMHSASGRYTITYNGEIYNHLALRDALGPHAWRGHSDTETLIEAIDAWGLDKALQRSVGMFAIALWDHRERTLTLVRDRLGEKPLYIARTARGLAFASELKALTLVPDVDLGVDEEAVALYLQLGNVPAPLSIYRGIRKLEPAHRITFRSPTAGAVAERYWDPTVAAGSVDDCSDEEALERFESLLMDSVRGQLLADVPLGSFLSGGVDSSLITSMMQRASSTRVRSFSIGFAEAEFDESVQARAVADHVGTDHTELHVTASDALELIPTIPDVYDEPFADASQIPTLLLAQLTRRHVTVALSGDGGDELFGGYTRYLAANRLWPLLQRIPAPLRSGAASLLTAVPARWWDGVNAIRGRHDSANTTTALAEKLHKLAGLIGAPDWSAAYRAAIVHWDNPSTLMGRPARGVQLAAPTADTLAEQMMRWDILGYLPDDILVKVDRATMRHSLEARTPLLDHRIVEFALAQPLSRKIRNRESKWLMRQLLYRHVPRSLIERPKKGFTLPLGTWLRGPLREWASDMLSPSALKAAGWLESVPVQRAWQEHLSGLRNNQQRLWILLMLQAWAQKGPR